MSITNYADLQTSVADWMHRTDLSAKIPDFIRLAESNINRDLNLQPGELELAMTATVANRYMPLPSDFGSPLAMWLTTYQPRQEIIYRRPTDIILGIGSSMPRYWTVDGTNIALDSNPDFAYTFTFRYSPVLNIATVVNWLITNYPGVYLYASLIQGAIYIRDSDALANWQTFYADELQKVKDKLARTDALSTLFVDKAIRNHTVAGAIFAG
jgi:hypothetical protein